LDHPGLQQYGPFDAIHVGAAASNLPQVNAAHHIPAQQFVIQASVLPFPLLEM
jgi:protein-L-isoaspartate O-methyltransferase